MLLSGNARNYGRYIPHQKIKGGEGIIREALGTITKEVAEVASEDEDTEASKVASICRTVLSSEGSLYKRVACPLFNTKMKKQKISACVTVLSSDSKINAERLCCIFPGSVLEIQNEIKEIFEEEISILFKSEKMRKVFRNINVCAIVKNKKKHQKPCCKNKNIGYKLKVGNSYRHVVLVIRTITVCNLSFMIVDMV